MSRDMSRVYVEKTYLERRRLRDDGEHLHLPDAAALWPVGIGDLGSRISSRSGRGGGAAGSRWRGFGDVAPVPCSAL